MGFSSEVKSGRPVLVEGSMYDRLKRLAGDDFDSELGHLGLVYSTRGQNALRSAYSLYVEAASNFDLPIILFTPTWRANQERIANSTLNRPAANKEAADFLVGLRNSFSTKQVFVGGLIGCKNDCYSPHLGLTEDLAEQFHDPQIAALADSGVDFLFSSTLPAVPEAIGMARSMAKTGRPYILSFVADKNGATLDGLSLAQAFKKIDEAISQPPLGYFVNCTHPTVLMAGLEQAGISADDLRGRLIGFQGNTSLRDPGEFDSLPELETEKPADFASATINLRGKFGISLLGGCCGTGPEHIEAIGKSLAKVT